MDETGTASQTTASILIRMKCSRANSMDLANSETCKEPLLSLDRLTWILADGDQINENIHPGTVPKNSIKS